MSDLQDATIKVLQEDNKLENKLIYKIILKDGTEFDKQYNDLKTAQEEAEKLDAQNVKSQYQDNSINGLFQSFIQKEYFTKQSSYKYENDKFYHKTNSGWKEENNQDLYYKMSIKLPPYLLGKRADPYSVSDYGDTFLIVDTQDGSVYEYEDISNYCTLKEYKQQLEKVLNRTYGETLYLPYYWDPLNY